MSEQHDEPYGGNCGQQLTGLIDSSKCPECGKPLVEVLRRGGGWGCRLVAAGFLALTVVGWVNWWFRSPSRGCDHGKNGTVAAPQQ